jgi:hypothetical protein
MCVGIDFDNTIICYDNVFNKTAVDLDLIPKDLAPGKNYVRDYLREINQENKWIWLQGYVYGTKLNNAQLYVGIKSFLKFCNESNIDCFIISHKTKYPYSGDQYDLHRAASDWIQHQNLNIDYFFELTKEDKIKRINTLNCTYFIDDLPEFLSLPGFNENIVKILFDPLQKYNKSDYGHEYVNSWSETLELIKKR